MKKLIIILLLCVTVVSVVYAQMTITEYRDAAFRADSIEAAADTAELLHLAALDSTVNFYEIRIVQAELQRDSIDRELQLRPVVRLEGELRFDTLHIVDTVYAMVPPDYAENDPGVQEYEFEGVKPPFSYRGNAIIHVPSQNGIFNVSIVQEDPTPVTVRVGCENLPGGIRKAYALVGTDPPFSIVPGEVFQDPDICNPPVGFKLLPELSVKGVGWELVKGAGWMLLANLLDDGLRKAHY